MGLTVFNQFDKSKYFSLTNIDAQAMKDNGLNMSKSKLRELARQRPPYMTALTGNDNDYGQCRITNIYRYKDFKEQIC